MPPCPPFRPLESSRMQMTELNPRVPPFSSNRLMHHITRFFALLDRHSAISTYSIDTRLVLKHSRITSSKSCRVLACFWLGNTSSSWAPMHETAQASLPFGLIRLHFILVSEDFIRLDRLAIKVRDLGHHVLKFCPRSFDRSKLVDAIRTCS